MTVGEQPACDERRILKLTNPERQVNALGDLIDNALSDEDLDPDVRIGAWNATSSGASNESEMLGGAESLSVPDTFARWFETIPSTASVSSALCRACSRTSEPTSVSLRLRVERSRRRTPS
jgi:hypothetical protein